MKQALFLIIAVIMLLIPAQQTAAQQPTAQKPSLAEPGSTPIDALFEAGNIQMEEQHYPEALARYRQALKISPDEPLILYNAGMAAFFAHEYRVAVDFWQKVKKITPEDWQTRAKLIQAYQALGDFPARDGERKSLLELRAQNQDPEFAELDKFCREQCEIGGRRVMVFEYFELKGPRAVRYAFIVLKDKLAQEDYRISLGSYDLTNEVWAQQNSPKNGERLFHLDRYFGRSHETYGFFTPEPAYDDLKKEIEEIITGKAKPVSGTYNVPPGDEKKDDLKPF